MTHLKIAPWQVLSRRQRQMLAEIDQPVTAKQLHVRMRQTRRDCSDMLKQLENAGLTICLNPDARRSRLFGLTAKGQQWRQQLWPDLPGYDQPADVDWITYGYLCYSHRQTVVLNLNGAMQAAAIKRQARYADPTLCMSANNVRDVMPRLLELGIVEVAPTRRAHRHYQLTSLGHACQRLLQRTNDRHARLRAICAIPGLMG